MTDTHTIMEISKGTDEDRLFDGAFNAALCMEKKDYPNYVGGLKIASGHDFPVMSPIDQSILFGNFQEPEDGLTDRAVEVAIEVFAKWSNVDVAKRVEIFENVLDVIKRQKYRIAAIVTISVGMIREESLEEVNRTIDILEEALVSIKTAKGKPIGVWTIISAHNSPLASPIGYAMTAMLAGNTVVLMPSKYAPLPIYTMYGILVAAGLPDGVMNLILDRNGKATDSLVNNPDIAGIIAIGSGKRLEDMMFLQADDSIGFINEIKGMNPILIYKPSNVKEVAKTVIRSAFSYGGQRLDSCSKVVVMAEEQKLFMDALLIEAKKMIVGDPADPETTVGPVISELHMKDFLDSVQSLKENLIFGGKQIKNEATESGFFVMPAIVMGLSEEHDLNNIDNALPILSVQIVDTLDDAWEAINTSEYGLSAGIISKSDKVIEMFQENVQADQIFVNDSSKMHCVASKAKIGNFLK
ncbi:MAG: aldehyde dehydrogenase family protein [Candidatus Methanomethylophilaceae archaeon]|jgi:acyl-CoA reductase-like NAD-dependent aldehyde dehydrogenase